MRRLMSLALVLPLLVALQACSFYFDGLAKARTTLSQTAEHVPGSGLVVKTRNGRVEVIADPQRSDVAIEARLKCVGLTQEEADDRLAQARISVTRGLDGVLLIKPIFPGGARSGDGASISIVLPDADGVELDTSNGSVTARGLTGKLVIDTSNGSVDVVNHRGSAEIDTSNGRVEVIDLAGSLLIDTSNGSVHVENLAGPATIDTSNSSIVLSLGADQSGPLDLDTSNGSIRVRVGQGFVGPVTLDTSNGSIAVTDRLGRIATKTIGKTGGRIVVGEGGDPSRLDTSNGRIEFTIEG